MIVIVIVIVNTFLQPRRKTLWLGLPCRQGSANHRFRKQLDDSISTQGLRFCQKWEPSERRGQDSEGPVAPLTTPVMWSLTSGSCTLLEDGCLTTANFPNASDGSSCDVSIGSEWTGFLFVEYMDIFSGGASGGAFRVDGERVLARDGQLSVHGMAPRSTLNWSPHADYDRWKLCQVNALPPWSVTKGTCYIDREGCFESLSAFYPFGYCWEDCVVEFVSGWEGSLNVVDAQFDAQTIGYFVSSYYKDASIILTVNGQPHAVSSNEDLFSTGAHGMVATGFSWSQHSFACSRVKICPMESAVLPGPWGNDPWTCTALGDDCTLPFTFNGLSFSACTQQLSDPFDSDQDGSLQNGHPHCGTATGRSFCGPCSCAAGEEQTYNMSSVYPHTDATWLVFCAPCAAGRWKSKGGSGAADNCETCAPGKSSPSGATACTNCALGMFNGYEMLECASCQPGFFGFGLGLTACQECAAGSHTSTEQQTACDWCQEGSSFVAKDAACQQCAPGTYRSASMSTCSPCDAGWYQNTPGQSGCFQCAVLDPEGPNPHLWTTLSRNGHMEWQEISGSESVRGCADGAWLDASGQCQECGVGITCKGMGEVEVLPGYFSSADSAGIVWRCYGRDWARCPGGLPGTCAQQRLNTSIACEECEPYTRMTNDGPCKVRCVVLLFGRPTSLTRGNSSVSPNSWSPGLPLPASWLPAFFLLCLWCCSESEDSVINLRIQHSNCLLPLF